YVFYYSLTETSDGYGKRALDTAKPLIPPGTAPPVKSGDVHRRLHVQRHLLGHQSFTVNWKAKFQINRSFHNGSSKLPLFYLQKFKNPAKCLNLLSNSGPRPFFEPIF